MKSRGFTLIEVIAAVAIVGIGIGAAFSLVQRTLSFGGHTASQLTASYLAQEGVELVRNIRDSNFLELHNGFGGSWDDGLTSCSTGCEGSYDSDTLAVYQDRFLRINNEFYSYDIAGAATSFKRKITITPVSATQLDVSVEVSWSERGRGGSVAAATVLYNWLNP
ncbi:MAG: prepilin-type N-terminal cleavage/methylation domain-containing protein [bacterium]|nr:prepilin-type N-terminal cleavage/methylation domain-containing protein [bacterium]